jgi:NADPH-dependent glutamate synthase beta subunit-like oxidoreductase
MIPAMSFSETYAIAVIGGAAAGAEAAGIFAERDILTVVFEQNPRPYGKVEDGLPRWHVALRRKEYQAIDAKLSRPQVHYVPCTRVGEDLPLRELADEWGFHAVVLANGAWRDRPLAIPDAERYVGKGLVYQNPFIYWFNHYNEASYAAEQFEICDGTLVIGGGLASIDVAKVINLELAARALRSRGIDVDLVEMETAGIPAELERHGLRWEDLGLRGCTLFYRRRVEDMPLVEMPDDAGEKVREKIAKQRARMLEKATSKYLFQVQPLAVPLRLVTDAERAVGVVFARTRFEGERLVTTDETFEVRGPLIISSIGSIPAPLPGVAMKGELYGFDDRELGRIAAYPTLFSVGNVVTGKGNIVASRKHARGVANHMTQKYLEIGDAVVKLSPLTDAARTRLLERIRGAQKQAGYSGDYSGWIAAHTPADRV